MNLTNIPLKSVIFLIALSIAAAQDPCKGGYPCAIGGFSKALTPGNVLAIRVGEKAAAKDIRTSVTNSTDGVIGPTFMDEIDMKGQLVQSLDLGSLLVPIRMTLFTGGTGPSEGLITTSYTGNYVIFGGYNMPVGWQVQLGPLDSEAAGYGLPTVGQFAKYRQSTWPDGVNYPPRILARVGVDGKIAIIAQDYNAMFGDTLRSTCSYDGESGYMVGHATAPRDGNGFILPDPLKKASPVMYYAGKGASGVAILENSIATSIDDFGNSRGCYITDVLTPNKPKLYVSVHTKYYFQWDSGVNVVSNKCSCSTNPATPKVACSASSVATCALPANNIDRGVFAIDTPDDKLPTGANTATYRGLPGLSADSRDSSREKRLTSHQNYERYCNFYFTDSNTMYISDAAYNTQSNGANWYTAQTYKLNYAPGIHKYVKNASGTWSYTPRAGYSSSIDTTTGGVIDGGFAANDLTVGKCDGVQYVFWASVDFQMAQKNPSSPIPDSLGSRLRYYKDDNGDIDNIAKMTDLFSLDAKSANYMMWRGIQWVPCTDTSNTCPGKVNTRNICASKGSGAISSSAGLVTAAVAVAGTVAAALS